MKKVKQSTVPAVKQKIVWTPYLLILPAVLLIAGVMLYPLCKTFYLAFQHYNPAMPFANGFAGLENFIKIFTTEEFYSSLWVSLKWVAALVLLQLVFGMIVALILNQNFKGRGFFRALVFVPWAMSGVLTAVLFSLIYNQNYGVLNDLLMKIGLISEPVAWLGNQHLVLGSVIVAELWRGIPFFAISLLAAMQGLPQDVYEAAKVDGATKWQSFRFVTLPLLKDTIVLTTLLRTIWEFNSVDLIFSLTNGGPVGKTTTLSVLIANQALTTNNYGYGSAISVVSFFILAIVAIIYMKVSGFGKGSDS
ncbi:MULTISPECIES: carbohydrate ABC transporter permease [Mediterraneibacter]|uniref:carbohydrate ABC transporter permease n=1 Tax=Mediterraneibacter TaxID=2316020 RepID=UPI000E4BF4EC|nr:sugar ABC transporter permease [Mediterraneibacter massiliensis]RGT74239.1 sugar ABC transporter permease [Ruminococcus sp. AF18-22]